MGGWTTLTWQDVTWEAPKDWEILQFSTDPGHGSCALWDRWQERLRILWNRPVESLDMRRMVEDSRVREEETGTVKTEELEAPEGWWGYTSPSREASGGATHAVKWFRPDKTLIEAHLTWPEESGRETETEWEILEGISVDTRSPLAHWRAFGIDVHVPRQITLKECIVQPGLASLHFEGERGRIFCKIRRLGLPEIWLKSSLESWMRKEILAKGGRIERESPSGILNREEGVCALITRRRRSGPLALLGAKTWRRDVAWKCEPTNRVFHVTLEASNRKALIAACVDISCDCGTRFRQGEAD